MSDRSPHSNPAMISEAVRRNGYCGEVSANGQWVCIKDAGHEDEHGDERWAGDDVSILRNYLFDEIGNAALSRLLEQLEALQRERDEIGAALGEPCAECGHIDWRSDGYADAAVARLNEQLEALRQENKQLRKALEHEVTERLLPPPVTERSQDASSPAKRPA